MLIVDEKARKDDNRTRADVRAHAGGVRRDSVRGDAVRIFGSPRGAAVRRLAARFAVFRGGVRAFRPVAARARNRHRARRARRRNEHGGENDSGVRAQAAVAVGAQPRAAIGAVRSAGLGVRLYAAGNAHRGAARRSVRGARVLRGAHAGGRRLRTAVRAGVRGAGGAVRDAVRRARAYTYRNILRGALRIRAVRALHVQVPRQRRRADWRHACRSGRRVVGGRAGRFRAVRSVRAGRFRVRFGRARAAGRRADYRLVGRGLPVHAAYGRTASSRSAPRAPRSWRCRAG